MSFKVEKFSQTNTFLKTQNIKGKENTIKNKDTFGQVILQFSSIPILKYSSHALIEIVGLFFDNNENQPPYHQVQKALKIISLMNDDEILYSDIQGMLLKNIHKKKDIYVFFCLWCQYIPIQTLFQKVNNPKTHQKIIYTIIYVYLSDFSSAVAWYQKLALKQQIKWLINMKMLQNSKLIQEIDAEISFLKVQNAKHFQFIVSKIISLILNCHQNIKISDQLKKIFINFLKNTKNEQFLNSAIQRLISFKENKTKPIIQKIELFSNQYNLQQVSQIIKNLLHKNLSKRFNSQSSTTFFAFIKSVFEQSTKKANQIYLRMIVLNWFVSIEEISLWKFFNENLNPKQFLISKHLNSEIIQKRTFSYEILSQLSKQSQKMDKVVQRIIFSSYIFHFFEGKLFNYAIQSMFLQNKSQIKFENERQVIIKVLKQIKNEQFLNIMAFNKSSFPNIFNWTLDQGLKQLIKKYSNQSNLKRLLSQVCEYWQKIECEMLKQNKKIELVFSVLRITIDKKILFVTVSQLVEILKLLNESKSIDHMIMDMYCYRRQYEPIESKQEIKKNKSIMANKQQQIHPIILEAKIVKLLKKTLKKATIEQISRSLNLDRQKTHQTVKKLVNKGLLQQNSDETYSYQP